MIPIGASVFLVVYWTKRAKPSIYPANLLTYPTTLPNKRYRDCQRGDGASLDSTRNSMPPRRAASCKYA